jgi:predicted nucleic acid-binding protein
VIVIDASVFVSALWAADIQHGVSKPWLQDHIDAGTQILVPWLVLSDVAGAVTRRTDDRELGYRASEFIQVIPTLELVDLDAGLALSSTELAIELRLRGADAVYVALAERMGMPLYSWDREQLVRGGQRVTTLSPVSSGQVP